MDAIKIATWNVNSIRSRLPAVLRWMELHRPEILCLQETKVQDEAFPVDAFFKLNYKIFYTGQKTYNGMAIVSALPLTDVCIDFVDNPDPLQKRFLGACFNGLRLINIYVPNGYAVGSPQFLYKLNFLAQLQKYLDKSYHPELPILLAGDFNIAPEAIDVYDPAALDGEVLFHPQERAALESLKKWGLVDLYRLHHHQNGCYSWWDYRVNSFRRNLGLRIDHLWGTSAVARQCTACEIDRSPRSWEKPSDHAPVMATLQLPFPV